MSRFYVPFFVLLCWAQIGVADGISRRLFLNSCLALLVTESLLPSSEQSEPLGLEEYGQQIKKSLLLAQYEEPFAESVRRSFQQRAWNAISVAANRQPRSSTFELGVPVELRLTRANVMSVHPVFQIRLFSAEQARRHRRRIQSIVYLNEGQPYR